MNFRYFTSVAVVAGAAIVASYAASLSSRQVALVDTGIRYVRDSEEYATLARQVYRMAGEAVTRSASPDRPWAVILDVDETVLDNSTYQVERARLGVPYDDVSWNAWVNRREAGVVPGAVEFVAATRRAGGRIAWITNRVTAVAPATRENLKQIGLWNDDDRLCAQESPTRTKRIRRGEVASGEGQCAWPGRPMTVVAFIGDQLGDFPDRDENVANAGTDAAFGRTCFLLPNPMYGSWTTRVTRVR